jgi:hypothetical protein
MAKLILARKQKYAPQLSRLDRASMVDVMKVEVKRLAKVVIETALERIVVENNSGGRTHPSGPKPSENEATYNAKPPIVRIIEGFQS